MRPLGALVSIKLVLSLVVTLSWVGCGPGTPLKERETFQAPQSQAATGQLVKGVSRADVEQLMGEYPEARFRAINETASLFEVYGVAESDLAKSLPHAKVSANHFIEFHQFGTASLNKSFKVLAKNKKLNRCVKGPEPPKPELAHIQPSLEEIGAGPVQLGTELRAKVLSSSTNKLKYAWVIYPPKSSAQNDSVVLGDQLSWLPDGMGVYQIVLIAQDQRDVCGGLGFTLSVTSNPEYKPQTTKFDVGDLNQFRHLDRIQAREAWDISIGEGMLIAVIDSGVNYNHPGLQSNVALNLKEIPGNDIDDDKNGLVDDYVGYDFANSDPYPFDDSGHGSHVAGLAASPDFGTAKGAKILSIKAMGTLGGDVGSIAGAIFYAVDRGANIINMSFGQYGLAHPALILAMNYAEDAGVLVVAAAGNGDPTYGLGLNNDKHPNFPSAFPHSNIVSVAASTPASNEDTVTLTAYSNFGPNTVDVLAPGGMHPEDLLISTYMDNPLNQHFAKMMGTSMASPVTAGVAAQVWSLDPLLTPQQVRQILMLAGEERSSLVDVIQSSRHLNALMAVQMVIDPMLF